MKFALMVSLVIVLIGSITSVCSAEAVKPAKISSVEHELKGNRLVLKINANRGLEYKSLRFETTPKGEHIFFADLPNTHFIVNGSPHYDVSFDPPSPVYRVRISQYNYRTAISRAVFFVSEPSLPIVEAKGNSIIFDISSSTGSESPKVLKPADNPSNPTPSKVSISESAKEEPARITQVRGVYESDKTRLFVSYQGVLNINETGLKAGSVLRVEFASDTVISLQEVKLPLRGLINRVVTDGSALMIYLNESTAYEITTSSQQLVISFQNPVLYRPISLSLDNEDLGKVILMLFRQSGANILVDKEVDISGKVTTQLDRVPLKYALDQILEAHGYGYKQSDGGIIRVISAEKLRVESSPTPPEEPVETRIFSVKHVDPTAISLIIQELTTDKGKVIPEPQTKTIVVKDAVSNLKQIEKTILELDQKPESEKELAPADLSQPQPVEVAPKTEKRLLKLSYADPDRIRNLLAPLLSDHGKIYVIQPSLGPEATPKGGKDSKLLAQATPGGSKGSATSAVSESKKRGGHIIIEDMPEYLPEIEEAVSELDKPIPQIDIQVYIVSGSVNVQNQAGIDWSAKVKSGGLEGTASSAVTTGELATLGSGTLQFGTIPAKDFSALLKTLSSKSDVQILSNPRITVLEDQSARFVTGKQVPFTTSETQTAGLVTTNTEFKDIGVVLNVTSKVMAEDMVSLAVIAEVSELESQDPSGRPIITTSNAATELFVRDGNTAMIGGFTKDEQIKSRSQIPILGDIPILGKLFGSSKKEKRRTEVTIFITPYIVSNQ